jgi:uncharacterized SAM-binding protein YcdF (DUF218 family)
MALLKQTIIWTAGVALWLLALGFTIFATVAMRDPVSDDARADGIVVLTGGKTRISEGARLLGEGRGGRLLISGVNPHTRRTSLQRLSGLGDREFDCCVDLGYAAQDTIGNALETRAWAQSRNYDSLIIVTANYHMPRSLAELARVMPEMRLIPHAVGSIHLRRTAWWLDSAATRLLLAEYLKFLPAAARLAVARVLSPWQAGTIAEQSATLRAKS